MPIHYEDYIFRYEDDEKYLEIEKSLIKKGYVIDETRMPSGDLIRNFEKEKDCISVRFKY